MEDDRKLIQLREFNGDADYEKISSWWEAHGWNPVPKAILPRLGIVAFFQSGEERRDAAAAWLYMDNSIGVSWLSWLVTNPEINESECAIAIKALTEFMKERAVAMDYGIMMTAAQQESLVRMHERNGFIKADEGVTHLIRFLR